MRRLITVVMACLLPCPGCLSKSYDVAHEKSLATYRQDATMHREPKQFANGRLQLRVPKLFSSEKAPKPAFLKDLDGFGVALEGLLDVPGANGEQMPVGLAVWTLTDESSPIDEVKNKIIAMVRTQKHPGFANPQWTTVDDSGSSPTSWTVMTLSGQQPFDRLPAGAKGERQSKNTSGTTQLWVASDAEKKVCAVLVWSVPEELATAVPLDDYAKFVVRTVTMKPGAEPAPAAADAPADKPPAEKAAAGKADKK